MNSRELLAEHIRTKRKEKNLKQDEVSLATGISRNYISDIERGRYTPSVSSLLKLAACLDLDLNLLKMTEIQVNSDLERDKEVDPYDQSSG